MKRQSLCTLSTLIVALITAGGMAAEPAGQINTAQFAAQPAENKLDLRMPDITTLYTSEQIASFLARTRLEYFDEIEVEGTRDRTQTVTPEVWPGIAAPVWALMNPTQAWRIFAPLPPDQTRVLASLKPDATSTFNEPAAKTAAGL
jgi:hypothetical protein